MKWNGFVLENNFQILAIDETKFYNAIFNNLVAITGIASTDSIEIGMGVGLPYTLRKV